MAVLRAETCTSLYALLEKFGQVYMTDDAIAKLCVTKSLVKLTGNGQKFSHILYSRAKHERHQLNFQTVWGGIGGDLLKVFGIT